MATKPIQTNPIADLPDNWVRSQIVSPNGVEVGLSQAHGYNHLMAKVNEALTDIGMINDAFEDLGEYGSAVTFESQTLTEAEQAIARKNIGAGGSNPNLLINPWFTVNQREATSGNQHQYPADRWWATYGQTGMEWFRNSDGSITISDAPGRSAFLIQAVEPFLIDYLDGKQITFSAIIDGKLISGSNVFDKSTTNSFYSETESGKVVTLTYAISSIQSHTFRLGVIGGSVTVKGMKLELGSVSTLENDTPPDYAEELVKCQYYFRRLKAKGAQTDIGYAYGISASEAQLVLPFSMGEVKSVTFAGSISLMKSASHAVSSAALNSQTDSTVCLSLETSGIAGGDLYRVLIPTGDNYIDLSAEL